MAGEDKEFPKLLPNPRAPSVLPPAEGQEEHLGAGCATAPPHLQQAKAAQSRSLGSSHRARVGLRGQGGSNTRGIRHKDARLDGEQSRRALSKPVNVNRANAPNLGQVVRERKEKH